MRPQDAAERKTTKLRITEMNDTMDFRKERLDEIMHSTELLEFQYKVYRKTPAALRALAIAVVAVAFANIPLF